MFNHIIVGTTVKPKGKEKHCHETVYSVASPFGDYNR
jgi:hypothetical protein